MTNELDYSKLHWQKKVYLQTVAKFGRITSRNKTMQRHIVSLQRNGWLDTNDTFFYFTPAGRVAYEAAAALAAHEGEDKS